MPKELLEIKNFTLGIQTTPSEADINHEAASYSLNVDPIAQDGKLQAIPDDETKDVDWADATGNQAEMMRVIEVDGVKSIITYTSDGKIRYSYNLTTGTTDGTATALADVTGTTSAGTITANLQNGDNIDMEVNNQEAHIGFGTSTNPYWAGKIGHEQFSVAHSATNGLYATEAELKPPSEFRGCYKLVFAKVDTTGNGTADTVYIYGIDWKGNRVYKFKEATAGQSYTFEGASTTRFTSTQGICQRYVGGSNGSGANETAESAVLWIYDAGIGAQGSLVAYDPVEDAIKKTFTIGNTNIADKTDSSFTDTVSDILETEFANKVRHVFFSKRYDNEYPVAFKDYYSGNSGDLDASYGTDNGVGIIYSTSEASFDETTSSGDKTSTMVTLTNRTPKIMATDKTSALVHQTLAPYLSEYEWMVHSSFGDSSYTAGNQYLGGLAPFTGTRIKDKRGNSFTPKSVSNNGYSGEGASYKIASATGDISSTAYANCNFLNAAIGHIDWLNDGSQTVHYKYQNSCSVDDNNGTKYLAGVQTHNIAIDSTNKVVFASTRSASHRAAKYSAIIGFLYSTTNSKDCPKGTASVPITIATPEVATLDSSSGGASYPDSANQSYGPIALDTVNKLLFTGVGNQDDHTGSSGELLWSYSYTGAQLTSRKDAFLKTEHSTSGTYTGEPHQLIVDEERQILISITNSNMAATAGTHATKWDGVYANIAFISYTSAGIFTKIEDWALTGAYIVAADYDSTTMELAFNTVVGYTHPSNADAAEGANVYVMGMNWSGSIGSWTFAETWSVKNYASGNTGDYIPMDIKIDGTNGLVHVNSKYAGTSEFDNTDGLSNAKANGGAVFDAGYIGGDHDEPDPTNSTTLSGLTIALGNTLIPSSGTTSIPTANLLGRPVSGLGIPHGTFITESVTTSSTNTTSFRISQAPTANTVTVTGTIYSAMVTGTDDKFVRSSGSFTSAGFEAGMLINVSGFTDAANNGNHRISSVTSTELFVTSSGSTLVNEAAGDTVTITAGEINVYPNVGYVASSGVGSRQTTKGGASVVHTYKLADGQLTETDDKYCYDAQNSPQECHGQMTITGDGKYMFMGGTPGTKSIRFVKRNVTNKTSGESIFTHSMNFLQRINSNEGAGVHSGMYMGKVVLDENLGYCFAMNVDENTLDVFQYFTDDDCKITTPLANLITVNDGTANRRVAFAYKFNHPSGVQFNVDNALDMGKWFLHCVDDNAGGNGVADEDGTTAFPSPSSVAVTGTTYAAVSSNRTITSTANNFISAGFTAGMNIRVLGFSEAANNTTHKIASVVAGTITLTGGSSLTDDAAGDSVTIEECSKGRVFRFEYTHNVTDYLFNANIYGLFNISNNIGDLMARDTLKQWGYTFEKSSTETYIHVTNHHDAIGYDMGNDAYSEGITYNLLDLYNGNVLSRGEGSVNIPKAILAYRTDLSGTAVMADDTHSYWMGIGMDVPLTVSFKRVDNADHNPIDGGNWEVTLAEDANAIYQGPQGGFYIDNIKVKSSGGTLKKDYKYFYKASAVYDGYQEGPLGDNFEVITTVDEDSNIINENTVRINLDVNIDNLPNLNKRLSGIKIYRAENSDTLSETPEGFYRLIKELSLKTNLFALGTISGTLPSMENKRFAPLEDTGASFQNYEANTGINEVIDSFNVKYKCSTQLNNTHFIGNLASDLDNSLLGSNYIAKSKPYNFNQYDLLQDILQVPGTVVAMASFAGRIFAFSETKVFKIEPNNLFIEDTWENIGTFNQKSVHASELGMCWCDKNNIYLWDGRQVRTIGDTILKGDSTNSWQEGSLVYDGATDSAASKEPQVFWDPERKAFLIMFTSDTDHRKIWVYSVTKNRWDLWDMGDGAQVQSFTHGPSGEVFYVKYGSRNLFWLNGHATTRKPLSWHSKKLTMGMDTQIKLFKKVRITGFDGVDENVLNSDVNVSFLTAAGNPEDGDGFSNDTTQSVYTLSTSAAKSEWLKVKIDAAENDNLQIDSIGVIYRRRPIR